MLYKNGINLLDKVKEFISTSEELFILVPYIKLEPLKYLLDQTNSCKAIVVRWEPKDLILGASDLDVYKYCKVNNITLYCNSRIHLKAFVDKYKRCFLGSANISSQALNTPESKRYNYELATTIENLSVEDRLYLNVIINESTLITDSIYNQMKNQLSELKKDFLNESDFKIKLEIPEKDFLISSLPMTRKVSTLIRIYETKICDDEVELNCAMHDLALYNLSFGLSVNEFKEKLRVAFFEHPFIKAFITNLDEDGEIYFGRAKEWIHQNCTNVPVPSRRDLTGNVQVLYEWFAELGNGEYVVDQPHHSQRISIHKKS